MDTPFSAEAMAYATQWVPMDNSRVEQELNFTFRAAEDSFGDAIRWLYRAGHITAQQAGKLASDVT